MLELGQFDLQLALMAPGTQGEYVQDQAAAIDHGAGEDLLQVALLARRKLVVEKHDICLMQAHGIADLGDFALAGKQCRIRRRALA